MKAKLIVDMPINCQDCCLYNYDYARCCVYDKINDDWNIKPEWCPLEPFETVGDYLRGTD